MEIELTSLELDLLKDLLDREIEEEMQEIRHTDSVFYKDTLKKRKEYCKSLLEKLNKIAA